MGVNREGRNKQNAAKALWRGGCQRDDRRVDASKTTATAARDADRG